MHELIEVSSNECKLVINIAASRENVLKAANAIALNPKGGVVIIQPYTEDELIKQIAEKVKRDCLTLVKQFEELKLKETIKIAEEQAKAAIEAQAEANRLSKILEGN